MQIDYTTQLNVIAKALGQANPWWQNAWILSTFSAVLRVIGGFAGQFLVALFSDHRRRRKLRVMGYRFAVQLLVQLDVLLTAMSENTEDQTVVPDMLGITAVDSPRAYMNANHDLYAELAEKSTFEFIFNRADALSDPSRQTVTRVRSIQVMIAAQFITGHLSIASVGKWIGREDRVTLSVLLAKYGEEVEPLTNRPTS
jgi:hypothetical protein